MKLEISIIIPVRNDARTLQKCLEAVSRSDYASYECIVVDDGSTDDTPSVASRFPVTLIKKPLTSGPAKARNLGVDAAAGSILFFIDADVLVYPDTLTKIAEVFDGRPELDAMIGSYDDSPEDTSFISQYKNLFHHYVHQNSQENAVTFWTGCGAIRREVFLNVGGFDVTYNRPAIEDIELGFRLKANNHNILLCKEVQVKHMKRWTFRGLLKTDLFDRGIPWTLLLLQRRFFPNDLNVSFSQRLCVVLVYLLLVFLVGLGISGDFSNYWLLLPPIGVLVIVLINLQFYRFYIDKRGMKFTVKVLPLHLLYYYYSGLSFLLGALVHVFVPETQVKKNQTRRIQTPAG